jgi:DNA processing protein
VLNDISVSPLLEMGAYEALWDRPGATFRNLSAMIAKAPRGRPSKLVPCEVAEEYASAILNRLSAASVTDAGVRLCGTAAYPAKLGDARHPLRAFYYRGWWDLVHSRSVAVVGARQLSEDGVARTKRLVRCLVEDGFTIVSGLAAGVDAIAHRTAIEMGGRTIAVLGTPITKNYPKENLALQREIAERFLLISQVPIILYERRDYRYNRAFFPERNITMSALTDASIIVEVGESFGTLIQSKAAVDQGRPLFLLNNCFEKDGVSWPHDFLRRGATRVYGYKDVRNKLTHLLEQN